MVALLFFLLGLFASPFKSKSRLEAENAVFRHQLGLLRRMVPGRVQFTNSAGNWRASVAVPMLRDGKPVGAISLPNRQQTRGRMTLDTPQSVPHEKPHARCHRE
jgi:hypothetical protein